MGQKWKEAVSNSMMSLPGENPEAMSVLSSTSEQCQSSKEVKSMKLIDKISRCQGQQLPIPVLQLTGENIQKSCITKNVYFIVQLA